MLNKTLTYGAQYKKTTTPFVRSVSVAIETPDHKQRRFVVSSNLANTDMVYELVGAVSNSDFTTGNVSHSFTTDSNGSYTINLILDYDQEQVGNIDFSARISSPANLTLATSSNVTIIPSYPMTATGGTQTNTGIWTTHVFDANSTFTVTAKDSDWATNRVYTQIIAGGGGGGSGKTYQERVFSAFNRWNTYSGGGGAAGRGIQANIEIQNFAITGYPIVIGLGGTGGIAPTLPSGTSTPATAGANTTFKGYTALGGGEGACFDVDCTDGFRHGGGGANLFLGASGTVYDGGDPYEADGGSGGSRTHAAGGGGAGTAGDGGDASQSAQSGYGANGGSGGTGITTWLTYPTYDSHTMATGGPGGVALSTFANGDNGVNPGDGGGGAKAGTYGGGGTGTYFVDGGDGANGQVRIAYKARIRKYA